MTQTVDHEVISEAVAVIDRALAQLLHRELVSTAEMSDLLLDLRTLLTSASAVPSEVPPGLADDQLTAPIV